MPHNPDKDPVAIRRTGRNRPPSVVLWFAGAALLISVVLVLSRTPWTEESGSSSSATGPLNVLLLTLDTTRVDSLGCYGHPVVQTPNIDVLARGGVRFTQCMTTAPITLPSHTSIMTATYPFVSKVRNNGAIVADEGNITLAEVLKSHEYATAAQVGAFVLDSIWGLNQGFDVYRSNSAEGGWGPRFGEIAQEQSVPAEDVCNRALGWLDDHGGDPFFLWVHFFDPHQPLRPPERFARRYQDPYLAEIAYVDEQIGRLMQALQQKKLLERTLVILTADHGEGRGQHQEPTHTYYVYDSTMHVPLIIWCPGHVPAGIVYTGQVSIVDIAPTILDMLGIAGPAGIQGSSLRPILHGESVQRRWGAYGETVAPDDSFGYNRLWTYRKNGWKYIHAPQPELYNVAGDPSETSNLLTQQAAVAQSMREELETLIVESLAQSTQAAASAPMDAEAASRLAALGYVGGYLPPQTRDEQELFRALDQPDPKDRIDGYVRFLEARAYAEADQPEKAVAILEGLVESEPDNPAVRTRLGSQLDKLERHEEARVHYEHLITLQPDNALARYHLGTVMRKLGRLEESADLLAEASRTLPEDVDVQLQLGLTRMELGEFDEAQALFRRVLDKDPADEMACTQLASLLNRDGRAAEAINLLGEGLDAKPGSPMIRNNLAWLLATAPEASLRDGQEAVRLARELVAEFPARDPALLDTLAAAHAESGQFEDARRLATEALELAASGNAKELADQIRRRLALYEVNQAYHQQP